MQIDSLLVDCEPVKSGREVGGGVKIAWEGASGSLWVTCCTSPLEGIQGRLRDVGCRLLPTLCASIHLSNPSDGSDNPVRSLAWMISETAARDLFSHGANLTVHSPSCASQP